MPLDASQFKIANFSDLAFWGKMFENLHTSLPANRDPDYLLGDINKE